MSDYRNNPLGMDVQALDKAPAFQPYTGVEVVVNDKLTYFSGTRSGRVLRIENPMGDQAQADAALRIVRGFSYQPYTATGALLNPAAELGDAVEINGIYSGIYALTKRFGPLMTAEISAPQDEELDHEYPFEPQQNREFARAVAETRAQISMTSEDLQAEITRAEDAEGVLRSSINANAQEISAKVSRIGGAASSFGWSLTDSSWTLTSGNTTVLKATAAGIEIKGKITATSGYIGSEAAGFSISSRSISNGVTGINDAAHDGVYVGTDGIVCGKGAFKVTAQGAITAKNLAITGGSISIGQNFSVDSLGNLKASNMTLSGTLTIAGRQITAETLRSGAQTAYSNANWWSGTANTVDNSANYWSNGAGWGFSYGGATQGWGGAPDYFYCRTLSCTGLAVSSWLSTPSITFGAHSLSKRVCYDRDGNLISYVAWAAPY